MTTEVIGSSCGNLKQLRKILTSVIDKKYDHDRFSLGLYQAYKSKFISRREYHDLFNEMEKSLHKFLSDGDLSNIMRRMDWRTLGEFALTIYDSTARESLLTKAWAAGCLERGLGVISLKDNGMDNEGKIAFKRQYVSHKADFLVTIENSKLAIPDGTHAVDIKYCPSSYFLTYKVADLESYIKDKAYILTFLDENKMLGANGNPDANDDISIEDIEIGQWGILTPDAMKKMLERLPQERYGQKYNGNKPSVRLHRDKEPMFNQYFDIQNWKEKT